MTLAEATLQGLGNGAIGWAFTTDNSTTPARQLRMVETVTPGFGAYEHSTANCYLADPTAFTASTLNNSFVFAMSGQYELGAPAATAESAAGRFDASGGSITNGYLDVATGGNSTMTESNFTGSFGMVDPAPGRVTLTLASSNGNLTYLFYLIDGARAFMLETTPYDGIPDLEACDVRVQQQKSWSVANVSGPLVFYTQGTEILNAKGYSPPSGYYSQIVQGTDNGRGNFTANLTYRDDNGTYSKDGSDGTSILVFDSSDPGRAFFTLNGAQLFLYFFDNNEAVETGITSNGSIETGWLESQSQTTFTYSAIAGSYMASELPMPSATQNDSIGEFDLSSGGDISGDLTVESPAGSISGGPVNMTYSLDTSVPGAGAFLLSGSFGTGSSSCAGISSTKFVCTPQSDPSPYVMVMQQ